MRLPGTEIGIVQAKENVPQEQLYRYVHANPAAGIHYYRIRQRDRDAQFSYSKTIAHNVRRAGNTIRFFPNPVINGTATVVLEKSQIIQLFNANGVLRIQKTGVAGSQQLTLTSLPAGVYLLKTEDHTVQFLIR